MRATVTAGAVIALSLGAWGCGGGYSSGSGNPVSPAAAPNAPGAITISVVAVNGAQSFSPNPATVPAGQTVVWHNIDTVTHRVVLNAGSVDTGDLPPGAFSQPMTIGTTGGAYHCSIHPSMVGSLD